MPLKATKTPAESSNIPGLIAKVKCIRSRDSNAEQGDGAIEDEDVVEEDRKSLKATHAADGDESEENYQSWKIRAELMKAEQDKWDRIMQPLEDALYRWCAKELQRGSDVSICPLPKQAGMIWAELKPFLHPHKAPILDRLRSCTGCLNAKICKRIGMTEGGNVGEARSAMHTFLWKRRIIEIYDLLREFRLENIYSCMETALHLRVIPYSDSKDVGDFSTDRSPEVVWPSRVSILLCANATGSDERNFSIMCTYN
ncbi:hypothetical protein BGZ47_009475 [Haplosporangium gracile]|nr:hypothetical protein BGZ47_009475 [Haplosporangium gracile]